MTGLDARLVTECDTILLTTGRLGFDYGCLLAAPRATGASPQPSLVLLAYAAVGIIALSRSPPGGLGIVEASLSGLLILADVRLATPSWPPWSTGSPPTGFPPLAGPPAYLLFRHRYGWPVPRRATPGESGQPAAGG